MSEWHGSDRHDVRTYAEGLYASAKEATGWELWAVPRPRAAAELAACGPECLPFSRAVCDEAAVAYALVALAKRAAAWGDAIDARLARSYRAAHLAMDAWEFDDVRRTTATEHEVDALFAAVTATHAALVRGYL